MVVLTTVLRYRVHCDQVKAHEKITKLQKNSSIDESLSTPMATFPEIFNGLLFRLIL